MGFHTEVLSDEQHALLQSLAPIASDYGYYLCGGTAVALHLGHRRSADFDWFSPQPCTSLDQVRMSLGQACEVVEAVELAEGTLRATAGRIPVSFIEYRYPLLTDPVWWEAYGAVVASLDDLGCMKLAAIAQRGSRRDFVDLDAIATHHRPLDELMGLYRRKYAIEDVGHVLVALTYFDDAEEEPMPQMLTEYSWDEAKRRILLAVRRLV